MTSEPRHGCRVSLSLFCLWRRSSVGVALCSKASKSDEPVFLCQQCWLGWFHPRGTNTSTEAERRRLLSFTCDNNRLMIVG